MTRAEALAALREIERTAPGWEAVFPARVLIDIGDFLHRYPDTRSAVVLRDWLSAAPDLGPAEPAGGEG